MNVVDLELMIGDEQFVEKQAVHSASQDMDVEDIEGDGEVGEGVNVGNEADCNGNGAASGTRSGGSSGEETHVPPPAVGMLFPSMEAIDSYYRSYGIQQGFAVVRAASSGYRGKDANRRQMRNALWTCDHYGRPDRRRRVNGKMQVVADTQIKRDTAAKTSKKCECPAMIYASVNGENEWQLRKVMNEHKNHHLLSHGRFLAIIKKQEKARATKRKAAQICNMLAKETNGLYAIGISERDPTNPGGHDHGLNHPHGANQCTLPDHLPSVCNVINNSTPVATQRYRNNHQRVEEHLSGANMGTLPTIVQPNECPRTFVVKATYKDDLVKVNFSLSYGIDLLKEVIGKKLNLEVGKFKLKYQDEDKDWVLVACVSDLKDALRVSESSGSNVVRLSIITVT